MHPERTIVAAVLLASCLALACLACGADTLRPEWSVGQDQVSPERLVVSAPPPAPPELALPDAVAFALERNVGFRRTIQMLLTDRSALSVALQRWRLTAFGNVTRTGDGETTTDSQIGGAFSYAAITGADLSVTAELNRLDAEERTESLGASLRQPLVAGSGRASVSYEEVRLARNVYRAALLSYFVDRQDLIASVLSAYFSAVERTQLVGIQESSVRLAEQAVRDAQLRLEAGLIAEIDLLRAQLRLARAQTDLVLARQSEQDALDQLLVLLGLEVGGTPKLATTVSYQPVVLDIGAAVKEAFDRRPEIRLADLSIENRQALVHISRSRRLPSLDIVGALQRTSSELTERSWNLGLEASVPIASRALTEAARQSYWALLVAQQEREDIRQRVALEVRLQGRAAEAARANVDIATKGLEMAQRSLQIAGRMVEEGLATNRDLLDAQDDLTRSGISLVSSKIDYYLATVRLRQSMGVDVSTDLPTERTGAPKPAETGSGQQAPSTGAGAGGV